MTIINIKCNDDSLCTGLVDTSEKDDNVNNDNILDNNDNKDIDDEYAGNESDINDFDITIYNNNNGANHEIIESNPGVK